MTVAASPRGCRLHPSADPSTGLCPSCLRHRLSYLPRSKSLSLSSAPRRPSLSHLFRSDPFPPHLSNQFNQHEHEKQEENAKTIKEHIEIDLQTPHSSRLWPTQKLHKWLLKQHQHQQQHQKKKTKMINHEIPIRRRRSCDTDPRISMIEEKFDEPRASWDGFMIARTIPRLPPMLSVIEKSLNEDETNSVSESFDCSSSGKNNALVQIDDFKPKAIDTNVIDTPPKSMGGSLKNKVLRILGFKAKSTETAMLSGKVLGRNSYVDTYHHRSPNVGATLDRARSVRYPPSPINFENGLLRFNLTPALPLSRKKKPERTSVLNLQVNARGVS